MEYDTQDDLEEAHRYIEGLQKVLEDMEEKVEDLRDENSHLRTELALASPRNVDDLIRSVNEYLDWIDSPNRTMGEEAVVMVKTQLRGAVDDALQEIR